MQVKQDNYQLKIGRIVKNNLDSLIFKCPYNDQCSFKGPTQKAMEHLLKCEMSQE